MTVDQLTNRILREKEAQRKAERESEAQELARLKAEHEAYERKKEARRVHDLAAQYVCAKQNLKDQERELAAVEAEAEKFGADMTNMMNWWERFVGTRAHREWLMERSRVFGPGPVKPGAPIIQFGPGKFRQLTEDDLKRINAYIPVSKRLKAASVNVSIARVQLRNLEEREPSLRSIGGK